VWLHQHDKLDFESKVYTVLNGIADTIADLQSSSQQSWGALSLSSAADRVARRSAALRDLELAREQMLLALQQSQVDAAEGVERQS